RSATCAVSVSIGFLGGDSPRSKPRAIVGRTSDESARAASGTYTTPSRKRPPLRRASSSARRVFPTPPAPTSVTTRTSERRSSVDPLFERVQPQVLESRQCRPSEQVVPKLGKGLSPEERQRLTEQRAPLVRMTTLRLGQEALEAILVELAVVDVDPVALDRRD